MTMHGQASTHANDLRCPPFPGLVRRRTAHGIYVWTTMAAVWDNIRGCAINSESLWWRAPRGWVRIAQPAHRQRVDAVRRQR